MKLIGVTFQRTYLTKKKKKKMQKETLCDIQLTSLTSLILLIVLFKIIDSVGKVLTKKRESAVFQNFLLSETTLWFTFPKKGILVSRSKLTQELLGQFDHVFVFLFFWRTFVKYQKILSAIFATIMDCHTSVSPTNFLAIINYYITFFLVQIEA